MSDLFRSGAAAQAKYTAEDIEVLEGLEPVRRRPGMYIGGTDERALHHLVAEVLDNAMDEAVAGHASRIEMEMFADGSVAITDNGRGIPVEEHPKYPGKSALEVILTTLHSGGKFSGKLYATSGGLHGVGLSVVNALSDRLEVEIARDRTLWRQEYRRGAPQGKLVKVGSAPNRRGTTVRFHPDGKIFGADAHLRAERLYRMARSKAYLFRGVEIRWRCDAALMPANADFPAEDVIHFPNGLLDFLEHHLSGRKTLCPVPFHGATDLPEDAGRVEWALTWPGDEQGFVSSYCNTVPTPLGGTHENGLRAALSRALRAHGDLTGLRGAAKITPDDVMGGAAVLLSVFIRDPQFQGQTKEKLATAEATRWVEGALKDRFDHWLAADPAAARALLEHFIERAEERSRRREDRDMARKTATRKLRLPGKLADCSRTSAEDTELFIVEGDSAGGTAKQARDRQTQAILPLRGKILNVESASRDKLRANQELADLAQALGCGIGKDCDIDKLRYERVIIMTDADVDGAHIASLLITFFFRQMKPLVDAGCLYLALPPLYRLVQGAKSAYARDDAHKDELLKTDFSGRGKVEISRFKGLGEMSPAQLKSTTMSPVTRTLVRVCLPDAAHHEPGAGGDPTADLVGRLMGKNAEARFQFIQDNAEFSAELDV